MAYNDYGAFVYKNGERRPDKEDVGVFDTDEASLPSGARIYANILKGLNSDGGTKRWEHSNHAVMGDGSVRVSCFKTYFPTVWVWMRDAEEPSEYSFDDLSRMYEWDDYGLYDEDDPGGERYAPDEYDHEFRLLGWHFHFWGDGDGATPRYGASMERDGESWECSYDAQYGAGFDE